MLYDVAKLVRTNLIVRGCPLPVIYGPERFADVSLTYPRIVIERPRARADATRAVVTRKGINARHRADRGIAGVIRIFAKSSLAGARVQEHEAQADQAADLVIVALQKTAQTLQTSISVSPGGLVSAAELDQPDLEAWAGVVYEIPIVAWHGVRDVTWAGESRDEITDYSIVTTGACVSTAAPDP